MILRTKALNQELKEVGEVLINFRDVSRAQEFNNVKPATVVVFLSGEQLLIPESLDQVHGFMDQTSREINAR